MNQDIVLELYSTSALVDPIRLWLEGELNKEFQQFLKGVPGTCSASWSLLWLGDAGQESCSSDEEWTSWSLSSIATGATVHSAISNHKGEHMGSFCLFVCLF